MRRLALALCTLLFPAILTYACSDSTFPSQIPAYVATDGSGDFGDSGPTGDGSAFSGDSGGDAAPHFDAATDASDAAAHADAATDAATDGGDAGVVDAAFDAQG